MNDLHRIAWRSWKYSTSQAYHGPWSRTHLSRHTWNDPVEPTTLCGIRVGDAFEVARQSNQGQGTCRRCLSALRKLKESA